jgi:hypothetical protein
VSAASTPDSLATVCGGAAMLLGSLAGADGAEGCDADGVFGFVGELPWLLLCERGALGREGVLACGCWWRTVGVLGAGVCRG